MEPSQLMKLRRNAGYTQAQLADALGFSLRGYQKLESGDSPIKPHHVIAIENILKEHSMPTYDNNAITAAGLLLVESLIKKLANLGVLEKTDIADMLTDIITSAKEDKNIHAADIEQIVRTLFVKA